MTNVVSFPGLGLEFALNRVAFTVLGRPIYWYGIIITSGEAQEIIRTCDRALVMYHGELRGELSRDQLTEENIMILSTGGSLADK